MIVKIALFHLAILLIAANAAVREGRISNGYLAKEGDVTHAVGIVITPYKGYPKVCSGTFISANWIVTAAQCTYGYRLQNIEVFFGNLTLNRSKPLQLAGIFVHPSYRISNNRTDIALLKLAEVPSVAYSVLDIDTRAEEPTTIGLVTGWGNTNGRSQYAPALRYTSVFVTPCQGEYYGPGFVCTSKDTGTGLCNGDEGTGLVDFQASVLVGVASKVQQCGPGPKPDIYVRVGNYYRWILETVAANNN